MKEEITAVGICTECHSEMPHKWMKRNVFAQEGSNPSCKYCGGVVGVFPVDPNAKKNALDQADRQRGL